MAKFHARVNLRILHLPAMLIYVRSCFRGVALFLKTILNSLYSTTLNGRKIDTSKLSIYALLKDLF